MPTEHRCRHDRTLLEGCRDCLGPDDWHTSDRSGADHCGGFTVEIDSIDHPAFDAIVSLEMGPRDRGEPRRPVAQPST